MRIEKYLFIRGPTITKIGKYYDSRKRNVYEMFKYVSYCMHIFWEVRHAHSKEGGETKCPFWKECIRS
jgi:hypothetical protein